MPSGSGAKRSPSEAPLNETPALAKAKIGKMA